MDTKLDTVTDDVKIENNQIVLTDGKDSIRQHLDIRLKLFSKEWFLDQRLGVPYFEDILKKNPSFVVVDAIFKNTILNTRGVTELLSFSLDFDAATRKLIIAFEVDTTDGVIDFTTEVIV